MQHCWPTTHNTECELRKYKFLNEDMDVTERRNVATGLDGISFPLLKLIAPAVAPSLAKEINCSIINSICLARSKSNLMGSWPSSTQTGSCYSDLQTGE